NDDHRRDGCDRQGQTDRQRPEAQRGDRGLSRRSPPGPGPGPRASAGAALVLDSGLRLRPHGNRIRPAPFIDDAEVAPQFIEETDGSGNRRAPRRAPASTPPARRALATDQAVTLELAIEG